MNRFLSGVNGFNILTMSFLAGHGSGWWGVGAILNFVLLVLNLTHLEEPDG